MAPNYNAFANNPYLNTQPQPQTNILWVQGLEGAKQHLVAANASMALWDTQDQKIYIKSCDQSGVPQTMRILSYVEETPVESAPANIDTSAFATKDDLTSIEDKLGGLANLVAELSNKLDTKPPYNNKKGGQHNG